MTFSTSDGCAHLQNKVVDSRDHQYGIRRRRECLSCGKRWTTIEVEMKNLRKENPGSQYRSQIKKSVYRLLSKQFNRLAEEVDRRSISQLETKRNRDYGIR